MPLGSELVQGDARPVHDPTADQSEARQYRRCLEHTTLEGLVTHWFAEINLRMQVVFCNACEQILQVELIL